MNKIKFALKMLYAQRKKYYTIFVEQVLITVVLMLCTVSSFILLEKYLRPGLLDVSNQFATSIRSVSGAREMFDKELEATDLVSDKMKEKDYVLSIVRESDLAPYLRSDSYYRGDTIQFGNKKYWSKLKYVDKEGLDMFDIRLIAGEWFDEDVLPDGSCPVVVTRQLEEGILGKEAVERGESLLGKKLTYTNRYVSVNRECSVIGVVAGVKQAAFDDSPQAVIFPYKYYLKMSTPMTLIKIKKGYEQDFYKDYKAAYESLELGRNFIMSIISMNKMKLEFRFSEMLGLTSQITPTLFFIVFAFLGTFGLFWMQSKKKAKEYALQIAIGLAPQQLVSNIVLESVLLSLFASIPALIVAFFIYDWTWLHVVAIGSTILIMVLFAVFSAWYPAYKVSRINPAEVLHYE